MKKTILTIGVIITMGLFCAQAAEYQGLANVNLVGQFLDRPALNITYGSTTSWVVLEQGSEKNLLATALTAVSLGADVWVSLNGVVMHAGTSMPICEAFCIFPAQ